MICPECRTENEFGTLVCQCGYSLLTGEKVNKSDVEDDSKHNSTVLDLSKIRLEDGTWICPCGVHNSEGVQACRGCGYSLAQTKIILESPLGVRDSRLNMAPQLNRWDCTCGMRNEISDARCIYCGNSQEKIMKDVAPTAAPDVKTGINWDTIIPFSIITWIWLFFVIGVFGSDLISWALGWGNIKLISKTLLYGGIVYIFTHLGRKQQRQPWGHAVLAILLASVFNAAIELLRMASTRLPAAFLKQRLLFWISTMMLLAAFGCVGVFIGRESQTNVDA